LDDQKKGIGIGALSRRTGCNIEIIRYYEKIKIMKTADRTAGGHRIFGVDQVKRLF